MKKTLLTLSLILTFGFTQAQNLITENFNVFPPPAGWQMINTSVPVGSTNWFIGNPTTFPSQAGATNSYIGANFNNTTGDNTISNWLITPFVSLMNGDVISFWSRTVTTPQFPDRLEMRISTAPSGDPSGNTGVGTYTTLALTINPNLTLTDYPNAWTQYLYTVTGLPTATQCKVAFRYFVTNGGPAGLNSDFIGIDTFSIDRTLSTDNFFASNFSIYPNPVADVLNIATKNGATIESAQVLDINGRIVNQTNVLGSDSIQINVSDLTSGVYFVKVQSELGVGTSKIIKN